MRTDRIGDVILSTPVIKAMRDAYPQAYIAVMVSPCARDIVEGNPFLDEVITYDKDGAHKSWLNSMRFSAGLRARRFDVSLILHPSNRAHVTAWLAGIRRRVGYGRNMGFLLTDLIPHAKQHGEKHEVEYALDMVRHLGIEPRDKDLYMPVNPASEEWVRWMCAREGIRPQDALLAVHPAASCPSKVWPVERFSSVADRLVEKYGFKVVIIAGLKDTENARLVARNMRYPCVNLAGKTSVAQSADILRRCRLFISNDSGPVHIASAVGTPVISLFGRKQKGLSPRRWGPVGTHDKVLYKGAAGCDDCRAHDCVRQFACLKAISVEDVVSAADEILKNGLI